MDPQKNPRGNRGPSASLVARLPLTGSAARSRSTHGVPHEFRRPKQSGICSRFLGCTERQGSFTLRRE